MDVKVILKVQPRSTLLPTTATSFWLQGILHPADAVLAVEHGADGIIVSNHGGRQLDTAVSTMDALPGVARAVDKRIPVLVDGGIQTGSDIIKVTRSVSHR